MLDSNKVQLVGRIGQDAEQQDRAGFTKFIFNVATSDFWTDRATGVRNEKTYWHRIEATYQSPAQDKTITVMASALKKGAPVIIDGSLRNREWKEGNKWIHWVNVIGNGINLLAPASGTPAGQPAGSGSPEPTPDDDNAPF